MVPAIMTASGAVLLGGGAVAWMFWWRRRKTGTGGPTAPDSLLNS